MESRIPLAFCYIRVCNMKNMRPDHDAAAGVVLNAKGLHAAGNGGPGPDALTRPDPTDPGSGEADPMLATRSVVPRCSEGRQRRENRETKLSPPSRYPCRTWRHYIAKGPPSKAAGLCKDKPCNFLLSHTLARAVPSGLRSLTSVFGMGTGGSSSLRSPRKRRQKEELQKPGDFPSPGFRLLCPEYLTGFKHFLAEKTNVGVLPDIGVHE